MDKPLKTYHIYIFYVSDFNFPPILGVGQGGRGVQDPLPPAQEEPYYASECPDAYGFYADATQCDKYYECHNWTITEKYCKDGMGFIDFSPRVERCDFLFNVDCSDRPQLRK